MSQHFYIKTKKNQWRRCVQKTIQSRNSLLILIYKFLTTLTLFTLGTTTFTLYIFIIWPRHTHTHSNGCFGNFSPSIIHKHTRKTGCWHTHTHTQVLFPIMDNFRDQASNLSIKIILCECEEFYFMSSLAFRGKVPTTLTKNRLLTTSRVYKYLNAQRDEVKVLFWVCDGGLFINSRWYRQKRICLAGTTATVNRVSLGFACGLGRWVRIPPLLRIFFHRRGHL